MSSFAQRSLAASLIPLHTETAYADSVYLSSSSVVSTASTASGASISALGPASVSYFSVSSISAASLSHALAPTAAATGINATAGLQGNQSDDSGFPAWAIALLVILGFLAFASAAGLAWVLIRGYRRRRRAYINRESTNSSTPMVQQQSDQPASPITSPGSAFARGGPLAVAGLAGAGARSSSGPQYGDGASTRSISDAGPFSGQDAAIMADAFRKALRKPDFADRPMEEGESPDTQLLTTGKNSSGQNSGSRPPPVPVQPPEPDVLSRELAEEGRDIRSVSSVRGVTVQSLEEGSAEGTTSATTTTHTHSQRKPS